MTTFQHDVSYDLAADFDAADITADVEEAVQRSGVTEGLVTIFSRGATAAVTTIEFEPGCLEDLRRALDRIAPRDGEYAHNARWGDGNGFSHLRSALLGPSITAPITEGRAGFSTWQQPIVVKLDNRPRRREVRITVIGE